MRIVHDTPHRRVIPEPARGMRVVGAVHGVVGALLLGVGLRVDSLPAAIPGAGAFIVGGLLVLAPAISTFYFNRGEKRLIVTRRRLWQRADGDRYDEYPLRDVVAAQVDEGGMSDESGSTFRVIVRMADGRMIPFTSYYTSGYPAKRAIANRISAFLGVDGSTSARDGAMSPHAIQKMGRRGMIAIGLVFVAFGGVFGSLGAVMLAREYYRLSEWKPVQATVLSARVEVNASSDGDTHRPVIVYRYFVGDRPYTSDRTLPVNEGRSGTWAYGIIRKFTTGSTHTAWYDPSNPAEAFIVRGHSIIAPVFTLLGLFAALGGCAAVLSGWRERVNA